MSMDMRVLGRSGIVVSPMGLGCWAIGGPFWAGETPVGWGQIDDAESIRAIHRALDLGVTFFDTADVYGTGHSEEVLARAFAGRRHEVVIATKFGVVFDPQTRQMSGENASSAYIRSACEASLRRLNVEVIDLYQFHLNVFPAEQADEVRDTLEALVAGGKIRAYGWSTDFVDRGRVFAQGPHCAAVQFQMNVLDDAPEMAALCKAENLAGLNRGPLAMGLLTGKYQAGSQLGDNDVRGANAPDWIKYFKDGRPNPEWLGKLEAIRDILTSGGRTLAQGALAWLWARSEHTLPIPGFKSVRQVEENCGAMAFGPLSPDQMVEIDRILEREPGVKDA
ncbi:MAG: aldo/keto reductase, partial [Anaerolineae bacterium]|nr:aldo/keto reductase [Anaerolineae bacterium]